MRKWVKRILLLVALLLVTALAVLYGGFRMIRATPDWYRRYTATFAEREAAAQRAFNKFVGIQNAAADARRGEILARNSHRTATSAAGSITVSFTDDELNAFFQKWSNYEDWKSNYDAYIDDPTIILRENRLILAARVKSLDTLVSVHVEPGLDERGMLNVRLADILGGRLSLPEALISPYERRVIAAMESRLPRWRTAAAIDSDGSANGDLIAASLARLVIHTLRHGPADPVLYLPLVEHHGNVPVRITGVRVQEHLLTVTVQPLDTAARAALVERIHNEEPAETAAAQ